MPVCSILLLVYVFLYVYLELSLLRLPPYPNFMLRKNGKELPENERGNPTCPARIHTCPSEICQMEIGEGEICCELQHGTLLRIYVLVRSCLVQSKIDRQEGFKIHVVDSYRYVFRAYDPFFSDVLAYTVYIQFPNRLAAISCGRRGNISLRLDYGGKRGKERISS